jgi:DNA-binding GntR family transcriptional regulator
VFLERGVGEVTPDEAMALNLSPGAQVVRYYRLRTAGRQPLALERTVGAAIGAADPALVGNSLYEAFAQARHPPARARCSACARIAFDAEQARLMQLPEGSPVCSSNAAPSSRTGASSSSRVVLSRRRLRLRRRAATNEHLDVTIALRDRRSPIAFRTRPMTAPQHQDVRRAPKRPTPSPASSRPTPT